MLPIWIKTYCTDEYEVSTFGQVRSLKNKSKGALLKLFKDKKGYNFIVLQINGKQKRILVHRLVYYSFHPERNPDEDYKNGLQVNHINEIKTDNRLLNLNLMTNKENCNWGNRMKSVKKPVLQYDLQGNFIREWDSTLSIEKELGYDQSHIVNCCNNKEHYNTAYGFIWKYKNIN